jgi:multicomponent Na+:H+ antiporter subunit E
MKNTILSMGILATFFLILSEKITITNIIFAGFVGLLIYKLNEPDGELARNFNYKSIPIWIIFVPMLFFEVVKANLQVAKIALSVDMKLDPKVIVYESRISDHWLLTILANVITLTPGTMSVDICDNKLKIHCLNQEYADGVNSMVLEKLLFKIEGGNIG